MARACGSDYPGRMFIDPPSPFSPLEDWQEFLAEMEQALNDPQLRPENRSAIERHIHTARREIERLSAGQIGE